MGLIPAYRFHCRDGSCGASVSTPTTNAANAARPYSFLLPHYGFADQLLAFRADPPTTIAKNVPSSVVNNAESLRRVAQIYRDGSGATVLGGTVIDASGIRIGAVPIPLKVERRPELVPADQVGGAPAPKDVSGQIKMGLASGPSGLGNRKVGSFVAQIKAAVSGGSKGWILPTLLLGGLAYLLYAWGRR